MFINLTNHPSSNWQEKQMKAASAYGEVIDIPFPQIPAEADEDDVQKIAKEYFEKITALKPDAIIVAGEFTFTYMLVDALLKEGITVVSSCSKRKTIEAKNEDGTLTKKAVFDFCRFRRYTRREL